MKPVVAVFAATDNTGGAGLLADCRAVRGAGCLPLAVVTGVSAQNLDSFRGIWRTPPDAVVAQFDAFGKSKIAAVKIGMLAGNENAVAKCIARITAPVVWDPIVKPAAPIVKGGKKTKGVGIKTAAKLCRAGVFVVTPNLEELRAITGELSLENGVRMLFDCGARNVLVTGIPAARGRLRHCLFARADARTPLWSAECQKRRGVFHGTGCLLSSTLAAHLAKGASLPTACARAHRRTFAAVGKAQNAPPGLGKRQKLLPQ